MSKPCPFCNGREQSNLVPQWRPIETAPTAEDSRFLVGNGVVDAKNFQNWSRKGG